MRSLQQFLALLCCLLLVAGPASPAFNAATEWDVRTTGNDANGGGFQVGATGTDYSQQDAAQYAYDDIVIGTPNTTATSVDRAFSALDPGNVVNITAGTNCTVQRAQIVSQVGGVATFDKALGTIGSTCTGSLGGSLLTPGAAAVLVVAGNRVHLKAGTYTVTSSVTPNNVRHRWTGYSATHDDWGTPPLVTTSTDSVNLFTFGTGADRAIENISMSHTAATRGKGIYSSGTSGNLLVHACILDGFTVGIDSDLPRDGMTVTATEIKNCSSDGLRQDKRLYVSDSYIHNNGGLGIQCQGGGQELVVVNSIITNNTGGGIQTYTLPTSIRGCTIAGNGGDGILDSTTENYRSAHFEDNIIYDNDGWGIAFASDTPPLLWTSWYNALGANTRGDYGKTATATAKTPSRETGKVTLTADPFTNAAAGDYSLNNAAGGGALLKGTGFPGIFPGGTTTGYLGIGAVESQAPTAGAHGSAFVN